jgi:hypothetical protein
MTSYNDIDEYDIKHPKVFLGFVMGASIFLVVMLCKEQFMNTYHLFST